jgi:hypothetical protein
MVRKYRFLSFITLIVLCCMWAGCIKVKGEGVKEGGIQGPKVSYDVTKEAQVTDFQYYLKDWEKKNILFYKIKVKNVSDKNHRYRVLIAIPEGDAVGGLLPDAPNKKFEPGKEMSAEYPVLENTQIPKEIEVSVVLMD